MCQPNFNKKDKRQFYGEVFKDDVDLSLQLILKYIKKKRWIVDGNWHRYWPVYEEICGETMKVSC